MSLFDLILAEGSAMPWYHGMHVSEAMELLLVFVLFMGTLATVYFIQRYIGDY